jgi:hypothetical protein
MRTFLIATVIGTVAVAVTAYAGATAVGVMADAKGWDTFTIAIGPLALINFQRHGETTSTLFGSGIMVISFALGLLNGALARRFRDMRPQASLADPAS